MSNLLPDIDYEEFLGEQESNFVRPVTDWREELLNPPEDAVGLPLPWSKTHSRFRFRSGECTIWAGINGHGKSLMVGQAMLWIMPHTRMLFASLEMKPTQTVERMMRQAYGVPEPSSPHVNRFLDVAKDHLWIYDQLDTVKAERVIGMTHWAAQELGIKHVVIDSLMKLGIGKDDYEAQTRVMDRLCWCAKTHDIHIHVVHHMRKNGRETDKPDKFDVRGAGEITDLVDNVLIVHRNKAKEEQADLGADVNHNEPDTTLTVAKQRHGEWEGRVNLWYHAPSMQYVSQPAMGAMCWGNAGG